MQAGLSPSFTELVRVFAPLDMRLTELLGPRDLARLFFPGAGNTAEQPPLPSFFRWGQMVLLKVEKHSPMNFIQA